MTIYSLDIPHALFGISLLFHVQLLLELHTDSQEAGKVVWYSHPFKDFSQFVVIHIVKGFDVVNEAEVDALLSCFSHV